MWYNSSLLLLTSFEEILYKSYQNLPLMLGNVLFDQRNEVPCLVILKIEYEIVGNIRSIELIVTNRNDIDKRLQKWSLKFTARHCTFASRTYGKLFVGTKIEISSEFKSPCRFPKLNQNLSYLLKRSFGSWFATLLSACFAVGRYKLFGKIAIVTLPKSHWILLRFITAFTRNSLSKWY